MNIDTRDEAFSFIDSCCRIGLKFLKLNFNNDWSTLRSFLLKLKQNEIEAYVSPFIFRDVANQDTLFQQIENDRSFLLKAYREIASLIPKENCLGISLPQNTHLITRVGKSKVGIRREEMRDILSEISTEIKRHGHTVVFPMRLDDVQGNVWGSVPFDIYDIETMLSHKLAEVTKSKTFQSGLDKPLWFGKAGQLGGSVIPLHQAKVLRRVKEYAEKSNALYAFLWSEKVCERHHWTVDGRFVVDVLSQVLGPLDIGKEFSKG